MIHEATRVRCFLTPLEPGENSFEIHSPQIDHGSVACWTFYHPHSVSQRFDIFVEGINMEEGNDTRMGDDENGVPCRKNMFVVPDHVEFARGMYRDRIADQAPFQHCGQESFQVHQGFEGFATFLYFTSVSEAKMPESFRVTYRIDDDECMDPEGNRCHVFSDCVDLPQRDGNYTCSCRNPFTDATPLGDDFAGDTSPGVNCIDQFQQQQLQEWMDLMDAMDTELTGVDENWAIVVAELQAEDVRMNDTVTDKEAVAVSEDEWLTAKYDAAKIPLDEANTEHLAAIDRMETRMDTAETDILDAGVAVTGYIGLFNTAYDDMVTVRGGAFTAAADKHTERKGTATSADATFDTKITTDSGALGAQITQADEDYKAAKETQRGNRATAKANFETKQAEITSLMTNVNELANQANGKLSEYRKDDLDEIDTFRTQADAFSAYRTENFAIHGPIVFDGVIVNRRESYSMTEGKFTAKVDGLYHFSTTLKFKNPTLTDAGIVYTHKPTPDAQPETYYDRFRIYYGYEEGTKVYSPGYPLRDNLGQTCDPYDTLTGGYCDGGVNLGYHYPKLGWRERRGEDYHSMSATLFLNTDDQVWVELFQNEVMSTYRSGESTFSGFLIHPDPVWLPLDNNAPPEE